jgi:hypothetical protein
MTVIPARSKRPARKLAKGLSESVNSAGYFGAILSVIFIFLLTASCSVFHQAYILRHQNEICQKCPIEVYTDTVERVRMVPYVVKLPADTIKTSFAIPCPDFDLNAQNSHVGVNLSIRSGKGQIVSICKEDSLRALIPVKDSQIKSYQNDANFYRDDLANVRAELTSMTKQRNDWRLALISLAGILLIGIVLKLKKII